MYYTGFEADHSNIYDISWKSYYAITCQKFEDCGDLLQYITYPSCYETLNSVSFHKEIYNALKEKDIHNKCQVMSYSKLIVYIELQISLDNIFAQYIVIIP